MALQTSQATPVPELHVFSVSKRKKQMPLPSHLKTKYKLECRAFREDPLQLFCAGADHGIQLYDVLNNGGASRSSSYYEHVMSCFLSSRWAWSQFRKFKTTENDNMERVEAKLYVGLKLHSEPEFRQVSVPSYFVAKLSERNRLLLEKDRAEEKLRAQITAIRNKVYLSRTFPARLRAIIFERDEYRCQNCLCDRQTLIGRGRHLELDHIFPWVDGGQTTYKNGITLCNECNNAKHHSKEYLATVERIRR